MFDNFQFRGNAFNRPIRTSIRKSQTSLFKVLRARCKRCYLNMLEMPEPSILCVCAGLCHLDCRPLPAPISAQSGHISPPIGPGNPSCLSITAAVLNAALLNGGVTWGGGSREGQGTFPQGCLCYSPILPTAALTRRTH